MVDPIELHQDYTATAEVAGLRYVRDDEPGIRRIRRGKGFGYVGPDGEKVSDEVRARCTSLAIRPAWTRVWICVDPDGHIQATGRDSKGRKQYRYHPHWSEARQMIKYDRLRLFGDTLPTIRARVEADLARRGLPEEKVLATVVAILMVTMIRVGNAEYARDNESFGLTTLRNDHVEVEGSRIRFSFKGKSGKMRELDLRDRRLARVVRQCQELRGQELFAWTDAEGKVHDVRSEDVNRYLKSISDHDFTAKEFRTWGGTVRCFQLLREIGRAETERSRKTMLSATIKQVAAHLGNTPTVCRTYYVHPIVQAAWADGRLSAIETPPEADGGLSPSELGLLRLLEGEALRVVA